MRRLPLAPAAHALRARPGGGARAARHRAAGEPAGGRRTCQDHCWLLLDGSPTSESAAHRDDAGEPGAVRAGGTRAADVQRGGRAAFFRTRAGARGARSPDPLRRAHAARGSSAPVDQAWGLGVILLKPESRGSVTLRSPVRHAKPRILHNYLTTDGGPAGNGRGAARSRSDLASRPALQRIRRTDFVTPET